MRAVNAWMLGIFAVCAVIAALWAVGSLDTAIRPGTVQEAPSARAVGSTGEIPPAVADYLSFVSDTDRSGAVEAGHAADGLRKLAGALGALEVGSPELGSDLRVTAEHVLLNPGLPATTEIVRKNLVAAADAIAAERYDGEASLRRSAEAVNPTEPLASQREALEQFLRGSADALEELAVATKPQ